MEVFRRRWWAVLWLVCWRRRLRVRSYQKKREEPGSISRKGPRGAALETMLNPIEEVVLLEQSHRPAMSGTSDQVEVEGMEGTDASENDEKLQVPTDESARRSLQVGSEDGGGIRVKNRKSDTSTHEGNQAGALQ